MTIVRSGIRIIFSMDNRIRILIMMRVIVRTLMRVIVTVTVTTFLVINILRDIYGDASR